MKAFKVVDGCYETGPLGTPIRRFTYRVIDQNDDFFARGEYIVNEQNYVVRGQIVGGGVWGPAEQNPDGSFDDFVGLSAPWNPEALMYQTFTATMLSPEGYLPGVSRPVMVWYPGYRNGVFLGYLDTGSQRMGIE